MQYGSFGFGSVELGGQLKPITPITPPAQKRFTLFIGGIDRTSLMLANTLQITNQLSQASTASLALRDATGTFHPAVGQDVQVFSNTTKIFGGTIDESTESAYQARPDVRADLKCTDYSGILDRRIVGAYFQGQVLTGLTTIVSGIVSSSLAADGIIYDSRDGDPGISLGDQLFQWITARQAFNQLSTATGWDFNVDYSKVLRFFPNSTGLGNAPFNIADNDGNVLAVGGGTGTGESATVRSYRGPYANRWYITSSSQATPLWTDIFSAAIPGPYPSNKQAPGGGRSFFVTLYILNAVPIVKVNGNAAVVIPLSSVAGAPVNSWDWYYIPDGAGVQQNLAGGTVFENRPLLATDVLEVDYQTKLSPATVATCAAQVALRASIEGNSGYYDAVQNAADLTDPVALANYANYLLNRYGCTNGIPNQVVYSTIKDGLFAGMLQTINLTQPLVASHVYLISQVTAKDVDKDHVEYQVTCDFGQYLATTSDQFFAALIARGQVPQPANRQTYTWLLAPTTFNVANPGITSTGTFPFPHICQNQVEVVQYWSVTPGHGPASNPVQIEFLLNNSGTVFSVVVPKGAAANTELRSYGLGPSQPPLILHAGDILQVFITLNSDAAMTDVNVTLVTSVGVT